MANEVRLIDANALIANKNLHINIGAGDNICIDIADIAKAPTIDPESLRPKGRWEHPNGHVAINGFVCSECGQEEFSYRAINPLPGGVCLADENGNFYYPPKMNYCPNCGAKMEG